MIPRDKKGRRVVGQAYSIINEAHVQSLVPFCSPIKVFRAFEKGTKTKRLKSLWTFCRPTYRQSPGHKTIKASPVTKKGRAGSKGRGTHPRVNNKLQLWIFQQLGWQSAGERVETYSRCDSGRKRTNFGGKTQRGQLGAKVRKVQGHWLWSWSSGFVCHSIRRHKRGPNKQQLVEFESN